MKITVYTIMKNESKEFFQRWLDSCQDADEIIVCDTGSTLTHLEHIQFHGASFDRKYKLFNININPWRFDDARNASLALVSANTDICICLDMDEILTPGWRQKIEALYTLHPDVTRIRYQYVWSWNEDGSPGLTYYGDKIHTKAGYRWKNPVHEVAVCDRINQVEHFIDDVLIEHHPDKSKSRAQYLPLMELAVKENPHDDRMMHYYGRELFFYGEYLKALKYLRQHISMPEALWDSEKARSWCYIGDCYWALGNPKLALDAFYTAAEMVPGEREAWVSAAQAHRALGEWEQCLSCCDKALTITDKPKSYINSAVAWSDWPKQMKDEATLQLNLLHKKE